MADKNPFANLGLGQLGNERQYIGSLSRKLMGADFNPLQFAAGYAMDKMFGQTDVGQKLMGQGAKPPAQQAAIGQGLSAPSGPVVPPNGGMGLAAPSGIIDYKPKSDIFTQPGMTQPGMTQPTTPGQPSIFDRWSKLSYSNPNEEE